MSRTSHVPSPQANEPAIPDPRIDVLHVLRTTGPGDRAVAEIARRQHSAIDNAQLLAVGLGPGAIHTRVRRGWLHAKHRGVYLVGHAGAEEKTEMMAAALAIGPGGLISHRAGCRAYRAIPYLPLPMDVSCPGGHQRSRMGIKVHRVVEAHAHDWRLVDGIPVVSPAAALLGYAGQVEVPRLQAALNEARSRNLVRDSEFEVLRRMAPRGKGWGPLGDLLSSEAGPDFSRSEAELRMWRLLCSAGFTGPQRNAPVGGYEVDFWWPDAGLVAEVDGWAFHCSREAFERDRTKWADLQAQGLTVLIFTWRHIANRRAWIVARVAETLARRAA